MFVSIAGTSGGADTAHICQTLADTAGTGEFTFRRIAHERVESMDDGMGRFAEMTKEVEQQFTKAAGGDKEKLPIFRVGETLQVRESNFQVRHIDSFTGMMVLKLLPRNAQEKL
jgi:hypothetical protein